MGSQTDSSDDQLPSPSLQREALTHWAPVISTPVGLEQVRSRCAVAVDHEKKRRQRVRPGGMF